MNLTRRFVLTGTAAVSLAGLSRAAGSPLKVEVASKSRWINNGVAVTKDNELFVSLPRWPEHEDSPQLGKRDANGDIQPFPGNEWNEWKQGDDGTNKFVYVNSVHIFADDTLWVVDMGARYFDKAAPSAQKLVQMNPKTGEVLQILRFDETILPPGARINDLRFYGDTLYMTESGLGALLVHDMKTGKTVRRLSGRPETVDRPAPPPPGAVTKVKHKTPKADLIEISPDGKWFLWASPVGPYKRVETKYLLDTSLSDDELAQHVETYFDMTLTGGSAMDTEGNLYLTDIPGSTVKLRAPDGKEVELAADPGFFSPDAPFISADHKLYVPCPQLQRTAMFGHPDYSQPPFFVYVIQLPRHFEGIKLGNAIDGTPRHGFDPRLRG